MKKSYIIAIAIVLIVVTIPFKKCGEQPLTKAQAAPDILEWEFGDPIPCEPPP